MLLSLKTYICNNLKHTTLKMNHKQDTPLANHHISVDCVIVGFDGEQLKVLLLKRTFKEGDTETQDMKLPGDLIYQDENLDDAANRVLTEQAGIKRMSTVQFKAYGSRNRTDKERDIKWLENTANIKVERIVTIAYIALVKIPANASSFKVDGNELCWEPVVSLPDLAFDHNRIVGEALIHIRQMVTNDPIYMFHLLPHKFTALQLRTLFERIYGKTFDVRNFQKKLKQMKYVTPLEEYEKNVAHRAARFYRLDKVEYNRLRKLRLE